MLLFVFSIIFAQPKERKPVNLKKISGALYEIKGGRGANGGLCIGDDALLLIDTKMDEIKSLFEENEGRLIEVIFYELSGSL